MLQCTCGQPVISEIEDGAILVRGRAMIIDRNGALHLKCTACRRRLVASVTRRGTTWKVTASPEVNA